MWGIGETVPSLSLLLQSGPEYDRTIVDLSPSWRHFPCLLKDMLERRILNQQFLNQLAIYIASEVGT